MSTIAQSGPARNPVVMQMGKKENAVGGSAKGGAAGNIRKRMAHQKLEYIHYNPVITGFVIKLEYWKYNSAIDYYGGKGVL